MLNIQLSEIKNQEKIDKLINSETKRKISKVPAAENFNIMTACFIHGEFMCVTEYDLPDYLFNDLKNA